ncbi:MAG: S-methyl-5'-thioadenosine phosphorylase [Nitrospiraceae bacterium]|jgi:5'-methylthioadenosine phosphorylase|nr:MAG: S-methyl-5'-thioadenosine phosphorylase [Nitrospiraceae bacterium]
MPVLGVIGGSGLYDIPGLEITDSERITTPYGDPSDVYRIGKLAGAEVAFLPRHGTMHHIQPHKINYRANIWGFRELGVKKILSVGASGGISGSMEPGTVAVPDQIIDMTSGRHSTFYEDDEVVHIDFTEPFCTDLRERIFAASEKAGIRIIRKGTYICVNGPRLETGAEIRAFSILGADMVGMTAMPEAVLARELELCFAGISVVTNFAAGISGQKLTATEVVEFMKASTEKIKELLKAFFVMDFSTSVCFCGQALKDAKM